MAVNKVVVNTDNGEQTLIDLTEDSVTPEALAKGATAHNAKGEQITGTMRKVDELLESVNVSDTLLWDGNTEGKQSFDLITTEGTLTYYNVSENVITFDDLKNGYILEMSDLSKTMSVGLKVTDIEKVNDKVIFDQSIPFVAFVLEDNATLYGSTIPKKGIYFIYGELTGYVSRIKIEGYTGFNSDIEVIKNKYIPKHSHSWNDLFDKPEAVSIPDYWYGAFTETDGTTYTNYLEEKIANIKALQDKGGKDAFSFVVMTDMHYPSNLAHRAPTIAKKILDECDIRYALCLGDVQTRGCWTTKEQLLAENKDIETMLSPIRDRLLQTEGNHDGSYGWLDRDGNGKYENEYADGSIKPVAERESYVYNLTPAELHSAIYRKVGLAGDVHFDESGSGYYIDDIANKVRYIVLNTQYNEYELNADGTAKNPKMWLFNFGQSQFDLVVKALENVPEKSWGVVVAGHCPLWQEISDADKMIGILNAYKEKKTYTIGNTGGSAPKENYADPYTTGTPIEDYWADDYRISSGGVVTDSSSKDILALTNKISVTFGDVIEVSGVSWNAGLRYGFWFEQVGGSHAGEITLQPNYYNTDTTIGSINYVTISNMTDNSATFTITDIESAHKPLYLRFTINKDDNYDNVVIKVKSANGNTTDGEGESIIYDFTNANGELVGYFAGHVHTDDDTSDKGFKIVTTRCDAHEESKTLYPELYNERKAGTITEQSFDVFTVNKATRTIHATKIGAGIDREITY